MAGFSGASGVPKKYVDDLVAQSTAMLANAHFYAVSTSTNTIKISSSESGAGIIMFRCGGTSDPQIIAIRDANGYKVISGTASVSTANGILTITAPGTYCFGTLITSHACTISYGT